MWIKTITYANSVDPDETAHNESSHLDLQCLPMVFRFITSTPIFKKQQQQKKKQQTNRCFKI